MVNVFEDIGRVFSTNVGITAADIEPYQNAIGIPIGYGQPTPSPQNKIGFTARDEALKPSRVGVIAGTQPAVVSIPGFYKPMIKRTTTMVKVEPGIFGAFVGYKAADLDWSSIDNISTDTMEKARAIGSFPPVKSSTIPYDGRESMDGLTFTIGDIGQRMIPDAAQSFDWFAGGLLRAIKGRPIRVVDWYAGLQKEYGELTPLKTFWLEQAAPWMTEASDILTMPWSRNIMGQGWNAFALGAKTRVGGDFPATKGMLFGTVI